MNEARQIWIELAARLATPVLEAAAAGELKSRMPVKGSPDRAVMMHLEAVGRLLAGLAPWIELGPGDDDEGRIRGRFGELARAALDQGTRPHSPDLYNFIHGQQPIVDAAFLACALLRAPNELVSKLEQLVRDQLADRLESTRDRKPGFNNWLLFASAIEAALARLGRPWDRMRVDYALRQHDQWYLGDGHYGDGPELHWDYYNSYVIHPLLIDVLDAVGDDDPGWQRLRERELVRARRYAAVQERLIAPDGSFPPIGRSLAYRVGAFQLLAQMALRRDLPDAVTPAMVRCGLTAVIERQMTLPGTFDPDGWLTIGFAGEQPEIGEGYITAGSVYLAACGLLPLGLPAADPFWTAPDEPWTSVRIWSGGRADCDHALRGG